MKRNRLRGFNVSSELVLLNISGFENFFASVAPFLQDLKKNKINTPFFTTLFSEREMATVSCCFTKEDIKRVKELIQQNKRAKIDTQFIYSS